MHHPTDRITHTTAFVTPVVEHWLEREIAQWVHHEGLIRQPIATSRSAWERIHECLTTPKHKQIHPVLGVRQWHFHERLRANKYLLKIQFS